MMKSVPIRLCQSVSPSRIGCLMRLGFTERQARFLVHVLVFSGVFLERQYRAFTGLAHGQKTHDFLARLITAGYATPITPGALHRGRLFHVHYKPLYEAIGDAWNSPNSHTNICSSYHSSVRPAGLRRRRARETT